MLNPADPLVEYATFGKEVEYFLTSPIGDYLVKRAEAEIAQALEALKTVHPWRRNRIQQLQNQIQVAQNFQVWLADSIVEGNQAMQQLEEDRAGGS